VKWVLKQIQNYLKLVMASDDGTFSLMEVYVDQPVQLVKLELRVQLVQLE
jgi:hypothetical protein